MKYKTTRAKVLLVLHMAFQDGIDQHDGVMRYIAEQGLDWDIHIDRMAQTWNKAKNYELNDFDGAIVSSPELSLAKCYAQSDIPLVAVDWLDEKILSARENTIQIISDGKMIGTVAADEILKIGGYESVAFMPMEGNVGWSEKRYDAFAANLSKRGAKVIGLSHRGSLERQLRRLAKPAVVFAANDVMATKVLTAARNEGIPVPYDLSVLGVDNERLTCLHSRPPLASIQPDFEEAGYMAAAALHAMMLGKNVAKKQKYGVRGVVMRRSLEP
jgi:LacI family transcriptional regulator